MYTPIVSTVGLNGQLEEPPVAGVQSGSWISSFAPTTAIDGFVGLTATVDSFCLFCGKWIAAGWSNRDEQLMFDRLAPRRRTGPDQANTDAPTQQLSKRKGRLRRTQTTSPPQLGA